jgi:hypothetical protein
MCPSFDIRVLGGNRSRHFLRKSKIADFFDAKFQWVDSKNSAQAIG